MAVSRPLAYAAVSRPLAYVADSRLLADVADSRPLAYAADSRPLARVADVTRHFLTITHQIRHFFILVCRSMIKNTFFRH